MKLTKIMDELRENFEKNSILRGISYTHSATARYRNTPLCSLLSEEEILKQ